MTERDFCYWLQGFFELLSANGEITMSPKQIEIVKNHLNLVFVHSIDTPDPTGKLQATHDGKKLLTEDDLKEIKKELASIAKAGRLSGLARC